jgi:hypothetical protein
METTETVAGTEVITLDDMQAVVELTETEKLETSLEPVDASDPSSDSESEAKVCFLVCFFLFSNLGRTAKSQALLLLSSRAMQEWRQLQIRAFRSATTTENQEGSGRQETREGGQGSQEPRTARH